VRLPKYWPRGFPNIARKGSTNTTREGHLVEKKYTDLGTEGLDIFPRKREGFRKQLFFRNPPRKALDFSTTIYLLYDPPPLDLVRTKPFLTWIPLAGLGKTLKDSIEAKDAMWMKTGSEGERYAKFTVNYNNSDPLHPNKNSDHLNRDYIHQIREPIYPISDLDQPKSDPLYLGKPILPDCEPRYNNSPPPCRLGDTPGPQSKMVRCFELRCFASTQGLPQEEKEAVAQEIKDNLALMVAENSMEGDRSFNIVDVIPGDTVRIIYSYPLAEEHLPCPLLRTGSQISRPQLHTSNKEFYQANKALKQPRVGKDRKTTITAIKVVTSRGSETAQVIAVAPEIQEEQYWHARDLIISLEVLTNEPSETTPANDILKFVQEEWSTQKSHINSDTLEPAEAGEKGSVPTDTLIKGTARTSKGNAYSLKRETFTYYEGGKKKSEEAHNTLRMRVPPNLTESQAEQAKLLLQEVWKDIVKCFNAKKEVQMSFVGIIRANSAWLQDKIAMNKPKPGERQKQPTYITVPNEELDAERPVEGLSTALWKEGLRQPLAGVWIEDTGEVTTFKVSFATESEPKQLLGKGVKIGNTQIGGSKGGAFINQQPWLQPLGSHNKFAMWDTKNMKRSPEGGFHIVDENQSNFLAQLTEALQKKEQDTVAKATEVTSTLLQAAATAVTKTRMAGHVKEIAKTMSEEEQIKLHEELHKSAEDYAMAFITMSESDVPTEEATDAAEYFAVRDKNETVQHVGVRWMWAAKGMTKEEGVKLEMSYQLAYAPRDADGIPRTKWLDLANRSSNTGVSHLWDSQSGKAVNYSVGIPSVHLHIRRTKVVKEKPEPKGETASSSKEKRGEKPPPEADLDGKKEVPHKNEAVPPAEKENGSKEAQPTTPAAKEDPAKLLYSSDEEQEVLFDRRNTEADTEMRDPKNADEPAEGNTGEKKDEEPVPEAELTSIEAKKPPQTPAKTKDDKARPSCSPAAEEEETPIPAKRSKNLLVLGVGTDLSLQFSAAASPPREVLTRKEAPSPAKGGTPVIPRNKKEYKRGSPTTSPSKGTPSENRSVSPEKFAIDEDQGDQEDHEPSKK